MSPDMVAWCGGALPHSAEAILAPSSVDFVFCNWSRGQEGEAKPVTVGDFGKGSREGGFHSAMCPRVSHKYAHGVVGALRREFPGDVNGQLCPVERCEFLYVLLWFWHSNRARSSASITGLTETKG